MSSPTALVTGGGSGIGFAVAEHLIQYHGYKVAIIDIVEERVQEQAVKLGTENCLGLHLDVTDYNALAKAFVQTFEWAGNRLDLVFLNAGIGDTDSLYKDLNIDFQTGLPKPLDLRIMDVNLHAVLQGIHFARHFFLEKNSTLGGKIMITSSMLGLYPQHCLPLYSASKHALVGLVRSLAPVYKKDNVSINAILPAMIDTNLMPEAQRHLWVPEQLTPMDTALRAFDMVLEKDKMLTGQIMELSLGDIILREKPEYSRPNQKWACEQDATWEGAMEAHMPRPVGENAIFDEQNGPRGVLPS